MGLVVSYVYDPQFLEEGKARHSESDSNSGLTQENSLVFYDHFWTTARNDELWNMTFQGNNLFILK